MHGRLSRALGAIANWLVVFYPQYYTVQDNTIQYKTYNVQQIHATLSTECVVQFKTQAGEIFAIIVIITYI